MDVLVKAKQGVAHGPYNLHPGDEAVMDEYLARELSQFVDIVMPEKKAVPAPQNKMVDNLSNKIGAPAENKGNDLAAGEAKQSSALPAAPASPKPTAKPSKPGAKRGRPAK